MKIFLLLAMSFSLSTLWSQIDSAKLELIRIQDSTYQSNIKKSRLYGVYIPVDLEDAFKELDRLSPPEAVAKMKSTTEENIAKKLHFGLGRWMAYNWNFDEGSRFSNYLRGLGLYYTEDMIDFMLISYHRHIMKKPQEAEKRAKSYEEKNKKKALKDQQIIKN